MSAPRRSLLLSIAVSFAFAYAVSDIAHFFVSNVGFYERWSRDRAVGVVNELQLGQLLLRHDEAKGLTHRLADLRKAGAIDYFLLRKAGQVVDFGAEGGDLRAIDLSYKPNEMIVTSQEAVGTLGVKDYLLVIGAHKRRSAYLSMIFRESRADLLIDVLIVALMVTGIVLFFFRDILMLIRAMRRRDRKGLERLRGSPMKEAVIMAEGVRAYESQLDALKTERKSLRGSLAQSVRTELDSGRTPPYQFGCVMARTDINDYSPIYSTHDVEEFMATINEFFSRSSEAVMRHGGYVTDFVGDEIIYYFKEEEHPNAAAAALAATRDIHRIAESIDRQGHGYPFRVKSALSSGALRFGPQANGFALSGGVFVETVRILSQAPSIEDKERNTVFMPARLVPRVAPLCQTEFRKALELRGVPGMTRLHSVTEFSRCESLLPSLTEGSVGILAYFRSDEDLVAILERLKTEQSLSVLLGAMRALRCVETPSASIEVREAFTDFFSTLLERGDVLTSVEGGRLLSSLPPLAARIVARGAYDRRLNRLLSRCLVVADARVIANAVDAFAHFEPTAKPMIISGLLHHRDPRVVANSFVKLGLIRLGEEVISGLRGMIRSGSAGFQASACYAIGELARHYRTEDLPFYETHLPFRELLSELEGLLVHHDKKVRRQAAIALEKAEYDLASQRQRAGAKAA